MEAENLEMDSLTPACVPPGKSLGSSGVHVPLCDDQ